MLTILSVLAIGVPLLCFVEFNPIFPPWGSRKVLHIGTGLIAMSMDAHDTWIQAAVFFATFGVYLTVPFGNSFHFAEKMDVGILTYLTVCSLVILLEVEYWQIAPFFLADPAGAIVGRNVETMKLIGTKSLGGTIAVWVVAAACLFQHSLEERILIGFIIAMLELFSGKYDNACIGAFLLTLNM